MAQQLAKTVRVALNKGFVSEATPLTYPEDTTKDELNVALDRNGARYKRRQIAVEEGGNWMPRSNPFEVTSTFVWEFAAGQKDKSFLILQEDRLLRVFDLRRRPLSLNGYFATIDLGPHFTPGASDSRLSFTTIKGLLVVVGANLNSLSIRFNPDNGSFSTRRLTFRMRDFEWLTDPKSSLLYNGALPVSLARTYDSFNTGWHSGALSQFTSFHGYGPPLNKPYWAPKNKDGWTDVKAEWHKIEGGSTLIANGRFILDLYSMDRDGASGLSGVNAFAASKGLGPETTRFSTAVGYAGRVFYSGLSSRRSSGRVYFSQVVESEEELGEFYSKNDPTAEYLSDLLDTDGGYVDIPEAEGILKLHVFGTSLLVFATNGVWAISGVDDVFRATDYTVNSLGRVTTSSMSSFVSADGRPYWWTDSGISTVTITEFKNLELVSVTESTIKSFLQRIDRLDRDKVIGAFDEQNKQVFWVYRENGVNEDKVLVLDENHGAFLKWAFLPSSNGERVISMFFNRHLIASDGLDPVVTGGWDPVTTESGDDVVIDVSVSSSSLLPFTFVAKRQNNSVAFAYLSEGNFADWNQVPYPAFIETGYSFLGDISTYKNAPYLTVLCKKTENGWESPMVPAGQSSLFASVYWDGSYTPAYPPQQVYRIHRYVYPTASSSPFSSEAEMVQTKIVPRGRGRNMRIRFEAEDYKDFYLYGFETVDAKNTTV